MDLFFFSNMCGSIFSFPICLAHNNIDGLERSKSKPFDDVWNENTEFFTSVFFFSNDVRN